MTDDNEKNKNESYSPQSSVFLNLPKDDSIGTFEQATLSPKSNSAFNYFQTGFDSKNSQISDKIKSFKFTDVATTKNKKPRTLEQIIEERK